MIKNKKILHLTDFHLHDIDASSKEHFRKDYYEQYLTPLLEIVRKIGKIDCIIATGDFIDRGKGNFKNFEHAELILEYIAKMLSIRNENVGVCIGNHDFDGGIDTLAKQITRANFPFVNCNYDFTNTPVANKVHKCIVIKKGKLKIGITGCGVELVGLVPDKLFTNTKYLHPIISVQEQVDILKHEKKCHFIICLSHLGYKYDNDKISDMVLAKQTKHIDLIIGGHTHTFLESPTQVKNIEGKDVLINQVGWAGVQIGQLDYFFEKSFSKNLRNSQTVIVDKKSSKK